MDLSRLNISGDWHNDAGTLEKFSRDMSAYRILPALVVEPKTEEDVCQTRWREVDDDHPPRKLVLMKTPRK